MRPPVRLFRNAAVQACRRRGFRFTTFMEDYRLEDVLNEADANGWSAQEIASQVLFRCCVEDGRFNNFQVGMLSVITFLNDHFGPLGQGEQQAFRDLVNILNTQPTHLAIRAWVNSHYP